MDDTRLKRFRSALLQRRSAILYAAIGLCALMTELIVFYVLNAILRIGIPASNGGAMVSGFVVSFILNAFFNFKVKDRLLSRLLWFGMITFSGYWLSTFIILALVGFLSLPVLLAKCCSIPAFFIFQYTLNKRFTFRARPSETAAP